MSSAFQNEVQILHYLGLSFDPKADYTEQADHLIKDWLRYKGQVGALNAINSVIKLVLGRIHDPKLRPLRYDHKQQCAFHDWLRSVRDRFGPNLKLMKPAQKKKKRPQTKHGQRRARGSKKPRHKIGALEHERQIWVAKDAAGNG